MVEGAGNSLAADGPTSAANMPASGDAQAYGEEPTPGAMQGNGRKSYPVEEHGVVSVPFEDLMTNGTLDLYPEVTGKNLFSVGLSKDSLVFRAAGYVGKIPVNDRVLIEVQPRVPFANLERVLRISLREPLSLAPHKRSYAEDARPTPSLLRSFADALVGALAAVEAGGLHRQYVRETADTSYPRGRILMSETMRRHEARGIHHRATVSWFEPSVDTAPNRCLKYAVWYLARQFQHAGRDPDNRALVGRLSRLYRLFDGVRLDTRRDFLSSPLILDPGKLPSTRAYYYQALRLATIIARDSGVAFGERGGDVDLTSMVVNLEKVFEEYLRLVLAGRLDDARIGIRVLDGNDTGFGGGAKRLFDIKNQDEIGKKRNATPDIVLRRSDADESSARHPAILDVKYKIFEPGADRDDIDQVVTYGASYGAPNLVIAHPHHKKSKHGLQTVGRIGSMALYQYAFDLSADRLDEEEEAFASSVGSLIADDADAPPS